MKMDTNKVQYKEHMHAYVLIFGNVKYLIPVFYKFSSGLA